MKDGGKPMKERESKDKPACSIKSVPFPTEVTCPRCNAEIEIWSDEDETSCRLCGYVLYSHEKYTN